ncbi:MAG: hypothetical protein ABW221_07830 [Vicinamibacteria bacterium]
MEQSVFFLSLLVFVYTMAEFAFIRDLSERCPRTGLRALRLSGPLPGGVLPDGLATRLRGVKVRGLPDGRLLIRPQSWWESGPSADPTMNGFVGVLSAGPQQWTLEVRTVLGPFLFVAVGGMFAFDRWVISLAWFAVCAIGLAFALRHTRRVFEKIGAQIRESGPAEFFVVPGV